MISKFNNLASVVAPDNLSFGTASVGIIANFTSRKRLLNLAIKIRGKKNLISTSLSGHSANNSISIFVNCQVSSLGQGGVAFI